MEKEAREDLYLSSTRLSLEEHGVTRLAERAGMFIRMRQRGIGNYISHNVRQFTKKRMYSSQKATAYSNSKLFPQLKQKQQRGKRARPSENITTRQSPEPLTSILSYPE